MSGFLIDAVAFCAIVLVCIGIHELGHFVFAKLGNIRVDEFSIGFGPRGVSRRRGETLYCLRLLPLGGFVRMAGMIGLAQEADAGERNFYRASIPKRLVVMCAGIAFNMVMAIILFTVALMLPTPSRVVPGGAAATAGLHDGDSIVSIGGVHIDHSSSDSVATTTLDAVNATMGRPTAVTYRDPAGTVRTVTVAPQLGITNDAADNPTCDPARLPEGSAYVTAINGHPVGTGDAVALLSGASVRVSGRSLGSLGDSPCPSAAFHDAPVTGLGRNVGVSWKVGMALDHGGAPFAGSLREAGLTLVNFVPATVASINVLNNTPGSGGVLGPNGLQGPLGIATAAGQSSQQGLAAFLLFMGVVSMNVGYLNLLPIPFLDGGKILVVLIEAVRGRRMDPQREAAMYAMGLALLLLAMMFITIGNLRSHG